MVNRKGLGRGKGKGYKNLLPKDSGVHRDSARGIKQRQSIDRKIDRLGRPDKLPFSRKKANIFHLPIETVIYVPSTDKKEKKITNKKFADRIKETQQYFADLFGGYSKVDIQGGYVDDDGNVIEESVAKITIFGSRDQFKKNNEQIKDFLLKKQKKWGQESIGYEVEGDLYYISNERKKVEKK